jgi:hypothetical protein
LDFKNSVRPFPSVQIGKIWRRQTSVRLKPVGEAVICLRSLTYPWSDAIVGLVFDPPRDWIFKRRHYTESRDAGSVVGQQEITLTIIEALGAPRTTASNLRIDGD